jgi:hypothetical protein
MATLYGAQMTKVNAAQTPAPGFVNGTVRCFAEQITLASQTVGDTIVVARLPKGAVPLYGAAQTSVTLGTATLAIGITGATGKYRAAAVLTTTSLPQLFGVNAAVGVALTAEETVFITIAETTLPSSGKVDVQFFYAHD